MSSRPTAAPIERPTTTAELADAIRDHATEARSLRIVGAGTAEHWGARAHPGDAALDTTALTGVLVHNPEDMTVAVRAGTPLRELQQALATHGQRVALDPARAAAGATIGGLFSTADSGPLQQAYGSLRALVIGVTFVTADGTVVRSGGHVIKNVAGYDLAKLLHGSLGTLGAVAEVIVRLHPLPTTSVTIAIPADPPTALARARAAVAAGLEPSALEWIDGTLLVRLEGTEAGTNAATTHLVGSVDDAQVLTGDAEKQRWEAVTSTALGDPDDTVVRVGTAPRDTPWLIERCSALAEQHALTAEMASSIGTGMHHLRLRDGSGAARSVFLAVLREELPARKATSVVCNPGDLSPEAATRGHPPDGLAVMRAIKQRFDPDNRFGRGRFAPWF